MSEGFSTWITFVISFSFMQCLDVPLQMFWESVGLSTRITFVISCSFMNNFDVITQDYRFLKTFSTNFAIMIFYFVIGFMLLTNVFANHIFHFSMNNPYVSAFVFISWKSLFTNFTCEIVRWIHLKIQTITDGQWQMTQWNFIYQQSILLFQIYT